jgi:hypothetical protein
VHGEAARRARHRMCRVNPSLSARCEKGPLRPLFVFRYRVFRQLCSVPSLRTLHFRNKSTNKEVSNTPQIVRSRRMAEKLPATPVASTHAELSNRECSHDGSNESVDAACRYQNNSASRCGGTLHTPAVPGRHRQDRDAANSKSMRP